MKRLQISNLTKALICAGILTMAVSVSVAQQQAGEARSTDGSCSPSCYLGCYGDDINLSEEQKTQMKERIDRHREATTGLREQLRTLRQQSDATDVALNEASVRAAAQARANLQVELEVANSRLRSELTSLLTPEQKARRAEQQRQCQERMRNLRERRSPGQLY